VESSKKYDLSGVHGAETFRDLPEGLRLKLTSGAVVEIMGNPHDGAILLVKILESGGPYNVGEEHAIFYPEVREVVESA